MPGTEVLGLKLPARETRLGEDPYTDVAALVAEAGSAMHGLLDLPYALFGHSMGAYLAFECAARLEHRPPTHLFVSGADAPEHAAPRLNRLPADIDAVDWVRSMNGLPPEVAQSADLMELLAPAIRADLRMLRRYEPGETVVSVPVTVVWGSDDPMTTADGRAGWKRRSTAPVRQREVAGDHYYVSTDAAAAVALVADVLRRSSG